ncbi:MAG: corrinoid protein [Chloroflexi bacterium]|nr:corrinoid protein [Chloroflexota bacterium]
MSEKEILELLYESVLGGNMAKAAEAAQQALDAKITPLKAIDEGMSPAIKEVGERFGRGEMFLPEMVSSADAMEAALEVLEPHFEGDEGDKKGKVLIGTVKGDIHDIGKNIVIALLKVNGFDVIDIGRDIASTDFVDKAIDLEVGIIGLSGLLTTSLPMMRDIIQMLDDDGVRDQYKVIIGGGPTSQDYADEIGADGYGDTAYSAVELCNQIFGK